MQKQIVTILFFTCAFLYTYGDENQLDFAAVDRITYEMYTQQRWDELTKYGKKAIKSGIDYYYLRMRVGIAFYELEKYLNAQNHFLKALDFNSNDPDALLYLYYCYRFTGRQSDEDRIKKRIPERISKKFGIHEGKKIEFLYFETGPSLTNNQSKNGNLNLDGEANIYGENTFLRGGYYNALGLKHRITTGVRFYYSYLNIIQGKTKQIMQNDTLVINDEFPLIQNQIYINATIGLKKQFSFTPAFHFLNTSYTTIYAKYDEINKTYDYFENKVKYNAYIIHLLAQKDISIFSFGLFGGLSNLNEKDQVQTGLSVAIYPEGNLNLYSYSKFMVHYQDNKQGRGTTTRFIYHQMIGLKVFKGFWAEAFATFGELENYYEKNAYVVYNIPDKILFKWGVDILYKVNDKVVLTLEYQNLYREGVFLTYDESEDNLAVYIPDYRAYTYNNHIIIGGIKWKL